MIQDKFFSIECSIRKSWYKLCEKIRILLMLIMIIFILSLKLATQKLIFKCIAPTNIDNIAVQYDNNITTTKWFLSCQSHQPGRSKRVLIFGSRAQLQIGKCQRAKLRILSLRTERNLRTGPSNRKWKS